MNLENLQMMADMLGEVIDGTWKGVPVNHKLKIGPVKLFPERVNSFDIEQWADVTDCGFSACAVGHACFDKRFMSQGLYMWDNVPVVRNEQGIYDNWGAVSNLFGIEHDTARTLFHESHYKGYIKYGVQPKRVKQRVEELLATSEAELVTKYPELNAELEASRERPEPNE